MRLLFENWRKYLIEQEEGEGVLLYHATCSPPESFASGIDPTIAKGYGQGEGFYFYLDKTKAIKHGEGLLTGKFSKQVPCPEEATTAYIVISDEPITPETFDIDYEVFAKGFVGFIKQNIDYFAQNDQALGLGRRAGRGVVKRGWDGHTILVPNKKILGTSQGRAIDLEGEVDIDTGDGETLSAIAKRLAQLNPILFKEFEKQFLSNASAVKYNGKEKPLPLRIEDLEGNVVWNR